jgi:hypothetical protein
MRRVCKNHLPGGVVEILEREANESRNPRPWTQDDEEKVLRRNVLGFPLPPIRGQNDVE